MLDARAAISIDLDADAKTVFEAWVEPPLMERWLFKSPTNTLEVRRT